MEEHSANIAAMAAAAAVHAVSESRAAEPTRFNLPSFWSHDPIGWFQHTEAEFTVNRVPTTSHMAYVYVIRALPQEALIAVRDLTRAITADSPTHYLHLKAALLDHFNITPLQQCFRMLDITTLGDRRATDLYVLMQSLLPSDANVLFNALFIRILPEHIRQHLVERGECHPRELAVAADQLLNATPVPAFAASAAVSSAAAPLPAAAASWRPSNRNARSPVRRRDSTPFRPASPSRRRPPFQKQRSSSPRRLQQPPSSCTTCFYHYNFGREARKCQAPCSWQENE